MIARFSSLKGLGVFPRNRLENPRRVRFPLIGVGWQAANNGHGEGGGFVFGHGDGATLETEGSSPMIQAKLDDESGRITCTASQRQPRHLQSSSRTDASRTPQSLVQVET